MRVTSTGLDYDPEDEVVITSGGTEAPGRLHPGMRGGR